MVAYLLEDHLRWSLCCGHLFDGHLGIQGRHVKNASVICTLEETIFSFSRDIPTHNTGRSCRRNEEWRGEVMPQYGGPDMISVMRCTSIQAEETRTSCSY